MKMATHRSERQTKTVTVGFAERDGAGVAYAVVGGGGRGSAVRVGFSCRPLPALRGRDVGYAALDAVAAELQRRGLHRVLFAVDDEQLTLDLAQRRTLPSALIMPYVALRCTLNRFADARVERAAGNVTRDLATRARAELWLNVAA
jgi:hypothetical protein